jgi:hypothetical protein
MNVRKKKLYIFGDSFSIKSGFIYSSWINQLSKKYKVVNFSKGGTGCAEIFNQLKINIANITPDDIVLIGWSDQNRDFKFDKELQQTKYKEALTTAKELLVNRGIRHLVFWSFPSDDSKKIGWCDEGFDNIHHSEYDYIVRFENEIVPALIWFSKQEVINNRWPDEQVIDYFGNDTRVNHLGEQKIHNVLFEIVDEFIQNKISGHVSLCQRLDNSVYHEKNSIIQRLFKKIDLYYIRKNQSKGLHKKDPFIYK